MPIKFFIKETSNEVGENWELKEISDNINSKELEQDGKVNWTRSEKPLFKKEIGFVVRLLSVTACFIIFSSFVWGAWNKDWTALNHSVEIIDQLIYFIIAVTGCVIKIR